MHGHLKNKITSYKEPVNHLDFKCFTVQLTKTNIQIMDIHFDNCESVYTHNLNQFFSQARQDKIAQKLRELLRSISLKAWKKTEILLFKEVRRHRIKSESVNLLKITKGSLKNHGKALDFYTQKAPRCQFSKVRKLMSEEKSLSSRATPIYSERLSLDRLVKTIGTSLRGLRQKYTQQDTRLIDFVSMQFYHISKMQSQLLSHAEKILLNGYFKVIDDHLYMALQPTRTTAAKLHCDSVALMTVKHLFPSRTHITKSITKRIIEPYPAYHSYFGYLNNPKVTVASIHDMERFRVYLLVCAALRTYLRYSTTIILFVCNALCNLKSNLGNHSPNASPITTGN